jgi:hypothetical protein
MVPRIDAYVQKDNHGHERLRDSYCDAGPMKAKPRDEPSEQERMHQKAR